MAPRKAKDAAQQKIGEWTSVRRNASKATTTTKNENTSAPTEIRTPLKTQSPSDMNAMKNCTVRLEIMQPQPKPIATVSKSPVKKIPSADIVAKDKETDKKNVYDYSFDADEFESPMEHEDAMKDLIEKLAKENKIEVKKYRPKNVRKKKTEDKELAYKATTQKRRREKQPTDAEPPKKKLNLKNKQISVNAKKPDALSSVNILKRKHEADILANNNNLTEKAVDVIESKETTSTKVASASNLRKLVAENQMKNVNVQSRLRDRNNLQSTPKTSTPISVKAAAKKTNENNRSLFFDNASPLVNTVKSSMVTVRKQRLQLSAINDEQEVETAVSKAIEKPNEEQPVQYNFDDDDFDFGNSVVADEPQSVPNNEMDKENSSDKPGTSATALNARNRQGTRPAVSPSWDQPGTSASAMSAQNRPGTSASAMSARNRPGTSASAMTAQNRPRTSTASSSIWDQPGTSSSFFGVSNRSNIEQSPIKHTNDQPNVYTPTKIRDYGRSPLKNITSEVNNTSSPSFESMKSVASMPRSFGVLAKSSLNSLQINDSTKTIEHTLPEASYFSSRRVADDFDRHVNDQNIIDDCFGFGVGDDDEEIDNNETYNEPQKDSNKTKNVTNSETGGLDEIRSKLKRFLHNPDIDETIKKSKVTNKAIEFKTPAKKTGKTPNKTPSKTPNKTPAKTPIKSPAKTSKSPAKVKRNVFGEIGGKQKDIRNAFATRSDKDKHSKDKPKAVLFEEIETVQDRRRSYSKPERHRKRRISIDTDESEEEHHSDDEDFEADGKKSKRTKRRKKAEMDPINVEELEDFAKKTNEHFEEIDSFVMVVE